MIPTKSEMLRVPGATLYYKVRGSGPLLLILQGGDGDAEGSEGIVAHLVDQYTVVTYDRRGLSRSKIDDPAEPLTIATHGDDAHHLLAALTTEPAFVVGFSMGALIGLDLAVRYPEQVHILVTHEPPVSQLLPDAERVQFARAQEEVEETYRREGIAVAMTKFLALTGINWNDREPDVVMPRPSSQRTANLAFFLAHDAQAARCYRPDLAALKAAAPRIVPAGGRTSREMWAHRSAEALAGRLGVEFVEFPGGHNGHILHPRAFAAKLQEVLGDKPGIQD